MQRRFRNRDRRYWSALFEAELKAKDEAGAAMRQKLQDEEFASLHDGLVFMAKNDRKRIKPETVRP